MLNQKALYKRLVFFSLFSLYLYDLTFWLLSGYSGYGTGYTNSVNAVDMGGGAASPLIGSIDNLFFLLWISIGCCIYLLCKTKWTHNIPRRPLILYFALLSWNFFCLVRGGLNSSAYADWKGVTTSAMGGLSVCVPIILIVAMNNEYSLRIFNFFILMMKVTLVLVPLQIVKILASEESYAHIVIPALALLMLTPFLPYRKKSLIFLVIAIAFVLTIEWRTNELRIILLFAFLIAAYFRRMIPNSIFNMVNIIVFCIPIYFLISGIVTGKSVFEEQSHDSGQSTVSANGQQVELSGDTRTLLYTEVLADLVANNDLWLGKGVNAKYKSNIFTDDAFKFGRANVEVGALKTLMYTGIVGLVLNALILIAAIFLGTNRSNNSLTKFFAFFLALHWMLLFIENMISYNIYYYILWMIIGLCLSKKFRALSDADIRKFFSKPKLIIPRG